jgi:hypothetical protein
MTHSLHIQTKYKIGKCCAKKLRQNKKCQIEFTITNEATTQFPGGVIGTLKFGTAQRLGTVSTLSLQNEIIPALNQNQKITISTEKFTTYFSEHCTIELDLMEHPFLYQQAHL